MENVSKQQPDDVGNFIKGAVKGMLTSTLFMGLFYGILGIAGAISFTGPTLLTIGGAFIASTLFNGIVSVMNGREQDKNQDRNMQSLHRTQEESILPSMTPSVTTERTQETEAEAKLNHKWAQSTGNRSNNIEQILQNGSMSDKDRATAILAERQAREGQQQTI